MFLKVTEFHWHGLIGPGMAILGAALLLAAGSVFLYFRALRGREETRRVEAGELKRLGVFGILMIGVGLAAFAVIGGGQTLTQRFEFAAPARTEVGRIYYQPLTESVDVPLAQLIRKSGARVLKDPDRIEISRNVFIETPFIVLGDGGCTLEFSASGTEAEGGPSEILVGVLELGGGGTTLSGPYSIHELTPEAKTFRIPMRIQAGKIGAVRIEFLNAMDSKRKPVRVVTITNVIFKRQ